MKHTLRRVLVGGLLGVALAAGSLTATAAPAVAATRGGTSGVTGEAHTRVHPGQSKTTTWQWDFYSDKSDHLHRDSFFEVIFPVGLVDFDTPTFKVWDNKNASTDLTSNFTASKKSGNTWMVRVKDDRAVTLNGWREFRVSATYTIKNGVKPGNTEWLTGKAYLGAASESGPNWLPVTRPTQGSSATATLTTYELSGAEIVRKATAEAHQQHAAKDYTAPLHKPEWKVLFYVAADVSHPDGKRAVLDAAHQSYIRDVIAPNFKEAIEKVAPVTITPTVKIDTVPLTGDDANHWVRLPRVDDRLARLGKPGDYDAVLVFSKYMYGRSLGAAWGGTLSGSLKSSYAWVSVDDSINHKKQYPQSRFEKVTNYAVHEFAHLVSFYHGGQFFPDLENATGLGYPYSHADGYMDFHQDFLTGKVVVNGTKLGQFPKMWPIGSRFLNKPSMVTVRHVNAAGQEIAPTENTYGVAGDRYSLTPRVKDRALMRVSGSLSGTFPAGGAAEVTLEYANSANPVQIYNTGTQDQRFPMARKPGESLRDWAGYKTSDPVLGASYTATADGDGVRIDGTFGGTPIPWQNDRAVMQRNGHTYSLTKLSDKRIGVDVRFGSPQKDDIRLDAPGFVNAAATARAAVSWDILTVTPANGRAWDITREPLAARDVTWKPVTAVTISATGTAEQLIRRSLEAGTPLRDFAQYRTSEPITSATYTVTSSNAGTRVEDWFDARALTWQGNTATASADGHTYRITRLTDRSVHVYVVFGSPQKDHFKLFAPGFVNSVSAVESTISWDVTEVIPASTGAVEAITTEPRVLRVVTWSPPAQTPVEVQIRQTGMNNETYHRSSGNGQRWTDWGVYRTSKAITSASYTVTSTAGGTHDGYFYDRFFSWSNPTMEHNGNQYRFTYLSPSSMRIDVTFAQPQKDDIVLMGPGFVGRGVTSTVTWDVLSVTPQGGQAQNVGTEPRVSRIVTWS